MKEYLTKLKPLFLCTLLWTSIFITLITSAQNNMAANPTKSLFIANKYLDTNPDSAIFLYKQLFPTYMSKLDTNNIIKCYIGISDAYKNKGQYSLAYEHLWDGLLLSEQSLDHLMTIEIYEDLGGLYDIYQKYNVAIEHLEIALRLAKEQVAKNNLNESRLINIFYALAIIHRKLEKYQSALSFLDSCNFTREQSDKNGNNYYELAERGNIYLQMNMLDKAKEYLDGAHKYFFDGDNNFSIITGLSLGDIYSKHNEWAKASKYYSLALDKLERSNSHTDLKGELLKKLSHTNKMLGNSNRAYHYLYEANQFTDSLFNARTAVNNELFQIKNKYKETILKQNEQIQSQNAVIERNLLIHSRLKLIIGFILFAVLVTGLLIRMRFRLRKFGEEKKEIEMQAKFNLEKAESIMQIKNKELTSNTLQMIEKDQVLDELLQKLKKLSPTEYKTMKVVIAKGNTAMWEQFEKRFTEVNTGFYERLRKKHPDLTPTELKHCALLKLNFDSKEMVRLLNISLNSVNISRHRIRKKMRLQREDNLSNYIAEI